MLPGLKNDSNNNRRGSEQQMCLYQLFS